MKSRLINFLFIVLIVHLVISFFIILDLSFLRDFRPLTVYKTYLLPGPFFAQSRITDNFSVYVSWKMNDTWSQPVDPAADNFTLYHSTLSLTDLYKTRLSRSVNPMLTDSTGADIQKRKEFARLKQYLYDHYVPEEADSVQVWIVNKRVSDFSIRKDSVYITFSR